MKRIDKPHIPNQDKYIYTEGINYFNTGEKSIWGSGDKSMLQLLQKTKMSGKWLHLATGDGRYNLELLRKVNQLMASDIDKSALSKLWHVTPVKYRQKLRIKPFNLVKKFPLGDKSFSGVFCTGTLHLFPKSICQKIFKEIDRILKPKGMIIIDFASDIQRQSLDGKSYIVKGEPKYSTKEAIIFLKKVLKNYKFHIIVDRVPHDIYDQANPPYIFSSNFILLKAIRKI